MRDVVDDIKELAEDNAEIAIGDVLDEFGERSFAPFMLILAIIGILAACWCSRRSHTGSAGSHSRAG